MIYNGSHASPFFNKSFTLINILLNEKLYSVFKKGYLPQLTITDDTKIAYIKSYNITIEHFGIEHKLFKFLLINHNNIILPDAEYINIPLSGGRLVCLSAISPYISYNMKIEYIIDLLNVKVKDAITLSIVDGTPKNEINYFFNDLILMGDENIPDILKYDKDKIFNEYILNVPYINTIEKIHSPFNSRDKDIIF